MTSNEDDFMRFDSVSEDSQDDASGDASDDKIAAYLQQGFEMMMFCECKTCNTPLIKNVQALPEEKGWFGKKKKHEAGKPVNCVPFCASCESIVVTTNEELQVIWKDEYKHLMAEKGAVTLAIAIEVASKEYLLALAVAQGDEEGAKEVQEKVSKAPKTASPTRTAKYENGDGLLVVVEDDDETLVVAAMEEVCLERQRVGNNVGIVEVGLDDSPKEVDFELIEYKERCVCV